MYFQYINREPTPIIELPNQLAPAKFSDGKFEDSYDLLHVVGKCRVRTKVPIALKRGFNTKSSPNGKRPWFLKKVGSEICVA